MGINERESRCGRGSQDVIGAGSAEPDIVHTQVEAVPLSFANVQRRAHFGDVPRIRSLLQRSTFRVLPSLTCSPSGVLTTSLCSWRSSKGHVSHDSGRGWTSPGQCKARNLMDRTLCRLRRDCCRWQMPSFLADPDACSRETCVHRLPSSVGSAPWPCPPRTCRG